MLQPIVAVSGQFVSNGSLNLLVQENGPARRKLTVALNKLRKCTPSVMAIGIAPSRFRAARASALSACAHVEAGAALVDVGLDALKNGLGGGLLTRAAAELNRGSRLIQQATQAVNRSGATGTVTPTSRATTSTGTGEAAPSGVAEGRLKHAGYSVSEADVGTGKPTATAALEVRLAGGGKVTIYIFGSPSDATKAAKPFASVERQFPKQFALRKIGAVLYVGTVEQPAVLPIAVFNKIVSTAEGR